MKIEEMALTLAEMKLIYQAYDLSEQTVMVWHRLFQHEEFEVFYSAIWSVAKKAGQKDFPSVGQVQEFLDLLKPKKLTGEEVFAIIVKRASRGQQGFAKLCKELESHDLEFVTKIISFNQIRMAQNEELKFIKAKFLKDYQEQLLIQQNKIKLETSSKEITNNLSNVKFLTQVQK